MKTITTDGNGAASYVSYAFSQLAIIYPITPSSPMAELADEWQAARKTNLFGKVPKVVQMQSESGVAGAMHGALTCGGLATTYTCSQGLLLMLPDMYKIAGELLPTVFHVSARAIATHALSIFGDHQDVMACRQTGFALLCASTVQETADFALLAHLTTLKCSVPFLHFFDGFRTSHESAKIEVLDYDEMRSLLDEEDILRFLGRRLTPEKPMQRGTAQNPDTYFQNRETANRYYLALPSLLQSMMDKTAQLTGRQYHLFDYFGAPDAEHVVVMMGSGASAMEETVEYLNAQGWKTGLIKVRLYRPFDTDAFCAAIPKTCRKIAVLDRTKEQGSAGEPLYLDVCHALFERGLDIQAFGGRYGLGSKQFTPAMCLAVLENLRETQPQNRFTVGIDDDLTHTSLHVGAPLPLADTCTACKFFGLGSDGTVGANKNSVKIIGENTNLYVQAYFCYDSRKSGGVTVSHLRFGDKPIRSSYLIERANFTACHNPSYLTRYNMLEGAKNGGIFLLNCPWTDLDALERNLPAKVKRQIAENRLQFYVIDATKIAEETGLRGRTSTVMQAAFFLLNPNLMPYEKAVDLLKKEVTKKFAKKGDDVVENNCKSIDKTQDCVLKIDYPDAWRQAEDGAPMITRPDAEDEYFRSVIHPILTMDGNRLPTSAFSPDGSVPTGTTRLEKHGAPDLLPKWIPENCIQCNQCSFVCPHACIRPFVYAENTPTPDGFSTLKAVGIAGAKFRIQVAVHDCMGCGVCANTCPAKEKALVMSPKEELLSKQGGFWEFADSTPQLPVENFKRSTVKGSQFYPPLFEFSYACSGCGETAYIKTLTQLFGEKMIIANATGCSSIYGGSSPTCPYTKTKDGKGPAWANSLFEDNAEFGLGMRLAADKQHSVWIIGGDGWAYDIGYGGLDHVLASGENVNVLVLDSQVYSNTGGQASKATPMGATARFATLGKDKPKKDLGLMALTYGHVYVAQVSLGANMQQYLNALTEAESYDGPSLIIAYSPCISHGVSMRKSVEEQRRAVQSGYWPLYRYNPALKGTGKPCFSIDSQPPTMDYIEFLSGENRFAALQKTDPERAKRLFAESEKFAKEHLRRLQAIAKYFNEQE